MTQEGFTPSTHFNESLLRGLGNMEQYRRIDVNTLRRNALDRFGQNQSTEVFTISGDIGNGKTHRSSVLIKDTETDLLALGIPYDELPKFIQYIPFEGAQRQQKARMKGKKAGEYTTADYTMATVRLEQLLEQALQTATRQGGGFIFTEAVGMVKRGDVALYFLLGHLGSFKKYTYERNAVFLSAEKAIKETSLQVREFFDGTPEDKITALQEIAGATVEINEQSDEKERIGGGGLAGMKAYSQDQQQYALQRIDQLIEKYGQTPFLTSLRRNPSLLRIPTVWTFFQERFYVPHWYQHTVQMPSDRVCVIKTTKNDPAQLYHSTLDRYDITKT
jgi:hypothetical protein